MVNVGIVGYGNLGKALEEVMINDKNVNLVKIFSRRDGLKSRHKTEFDLVENLGVYKGRIDTLYLCVGSYSDIEKIGIKALKNFNTVDSYDTHKKLKDYIHTLDKIAKTSQRVSLSAFGWDPGLMSYIRTVFDGVSLQKSNSFWGEGVSQGHSNAIRKIAGVKNAIQYTVENEEIIKKCQNNFNFIPNDFEKHKRICFVAVDDDADKEKISRQIGNMPNYFAGYETEVNFVSEEEILKMQEVLSHKGYIVENFQILDKYQSKMEFSLDLQSNPHFTAQMMSLGGRIVEKLCEEKRFGAYSILDIPASYFLNKSRDEVMEKEL